MGWTRYSSPRLRGLRDTIYIILIAFLGSSILTYIAGAPFSQFYTTLVERGLGSSAGIEILVGLTTVLVLTGLSASIPFSAAVWNIGGEGQIYMGGLAATTAIVALGMQSIPAVVLFSMIAGAVWGLIPAILKFKFHTNEIVSTLLFNFVAMYLVLYAIRGPLRLPEAMTPQSPSLPKLFLIPSLLVIIVASVLVSYVLIERTRIGYEIQVVGRNPRAAAYAGINMTYTGLLAMTIGGAFAGLAGGIIPTSRLLSALMPGFSSMYGFVGIGVALMAKLRSIEIPFSAFIVSLLFVTMRFLSTGTQIPLLLTTAVVGMIMMVVAIVRRE